MRFRDTGYAVPTDYFPRTPAGTRVGIYTQRALNYFGGTDNHDPCLSGSSACIAAAGLSSRTADLWLTVAHELGHGLGALLRGEAALSRRSL